MKAKELVKILLENPDLDVEVCCAETIWISGTEKIQYRTYDDIKADVVKTNSGAIIQIDCM